MANHDWPLNEWHREQARNERAGGLSVDDIEEQWRERVRRNARAASRRRRFFAADVEERNAASPNEPIERSY